jgi:hypothetical protein
MTLFLKLERLKFLSELQFRSKMSKMKKIFALGFVFYVSWDSLKYLVFFQCL